MLPYAHVRGHASVTVDNSQNTTQGGSSPGFELCAWVIYSMEGLIMLVHVYVVESGVGWGIQLREQREEMRMMPK